MINLKRGNKLMTDIEVLDNIINYVENNVGSQDWGEHFYMITGYVASGIGWDLDEVHGYFKAWLRDNSAK